MDTGEIGPTWHAPRVGFSRLLEGRYPLEAHLMTARFPSEAVRGFIPVRLRQPACDTRMDAVAYSVMVWLVDPGEQAHQQQAMQRTTTGRAQAPGAASGVNEPPAFTRMVYGVYESLDVKPRRPSLRSLSSCERTSPLR